VFVINTYFFLNHKEMILIMFKLRITNREKEKFFS
jgi:hypothetical protein